MLSRSAQVLVPACTQQMQVRGMATLKEIRLRLKSVQNIKKITSSMKMVSAAKYARAERDLKPARAYGAGSAAFFDSLNVPEEDAASAEKGNKLVIAMTSDKGLCGGVHSHVCKNVKGLMNNRQPGENIKLFLVGDKANQILTRLYKEDVVMVCKNLGKKPPSFSDASFLAENVLSSGVDYSSATMFFNIFKTVVSYQTTPMNLLTEQQVGSSEARFMYDSMDDDILKCYQEFMLASRLYYALKECACSEQSARMTAMDSASKNADEMINKLTLTFNRTRQAVITRELIEIISGAEAL